jgi:hypothetical protein
MGKMRSAVQFQLETQKITRRHKRTWEYVIKTYLKEIVCGDLVWTFVNQDRDQWWEVVNMVINLRVTQKAIN